MHGFTVIEMEIGYENDALWCDNDMSCQQFKNRIPKDSYLPF